jgi:hypothetical protein
LIKAEQLAKEINEREESYAHIKLNSLDIEQANEIADQKKKVKILKAKLKTKQRVLVKTALKV